MYDQAVISTITAGSNGNRWRSSGNRAFLMMDSIVVYPGKN
jgi:hypothetical protein